jgi:hypothetical protein
VCLRCDWSGATTAPNCPRCGAPLYGAAEGAPAGGRGRDAPSKGPSRLSGGDPAPSPVRRMTSWTGGVAVAAVVLLAVAAAWIVRTHTPAASREPTDMHGFLVVTAAEGTGARLWVWDLASGTASPGPLLEAMPDALVTSYTVNPGWIGVTMTMPSGEQTAWVARFLEPTDHPVEVARGALVAWGASGGYVSVARENALGGCRRRLEIDNWYVVAHHRDRQFAGVICGEATALGRDRLVSYVEIDRGSVPARTISLVSVDELLPLITERELLSVSSESDLLVRDAAGELELYYHTTRPIPVESGGRPFLPTRVLTWSADASQAFVLGTGGDGTKGVYRIVVGPRPRPRNPDLILATDAEDAQATPTTDGDLFVAAGGAVSRLHDGLFLSLPLPDDAPPPAGPILWIGTLPSGSES